jgi:hypothetical protein
MIRFAYVNCPMKTDPAMIRVACIVVLRKRSIPATSSTLLSGTWTGTAGSGSGASATGSSSSSYSRSGLSH